MRVYVYPSDRYGCGMYRLVWPAQVLQRAGHHVIVTFPDERWQIGAGLNADGHVVDAFTPPDCEVIVLQRTTHRHLLESIPIWRERGIRVVIDIDDDLSCIHPSNPAYAGLRAGNGSLHDWNNLRRAAAIADMVTCSTPELAHRYPGNTVVLENYLPDAFYGRERTDSARVCWPASIGSHPDDPSATSGALNRLESEGMAFAGLGSDGEACQRAFALRSTPPMDPYVDIEDWPAYIAGIGIGIAPLADTRFNTAKSWLKVLELSACGVPWVASDRAEYRRFHEATGVGVLARDRSRDWYRAINKLLGDEVARKEASEAGREAAERFRIADHAWRWAEVWGSHVVGGYTDPTTRREVVSVSLGTTDRMDSGSAGNTPERPPAAPGGGSTIPLSAPCHQD